MKKIILLSTFIIIAGLLSACGSSESVSIGYFPNLDHAAGIVGKEKGFFEEELTNVDVDFVNFPNGNDFIEALDSGSIQLGYVGPGPAINYFLSGGDIVVLGAAANGATLIVAREDSGIETLEDFANKSFGSPGNGCTHNVQLEVMLQEIGLITSRRGGEVEHEPRISPANTMIRFEQGDIDVYTAPEPWGTHLVEELGAKVILEWDEVFLGEQLPSVVVVTTTKFLKENPEQVDQFLRAHKRSIEFAQQNEKETLETINELIYNLSQTRFSDTVLEKAWQRMVVTSETHAEALQAWATASYELNFIDNEPNLDGFVDTSRLDKVLAEN